MKVLSSKSFSIKAPFLAPHSLVLLLALTLSGCTAVSPGEVSEVHSAWVTSWSMSPSSLPPSADAGHAFADQTLRQVVYTSAGGDSLRIRLSNVHGSQPLEVGGVTVALQQEGSSIVPGSLAEVTFSQRSSFTIPRGAVLFSDPLAFEVPPLSHLSVSLYLPEPSGAPTLHLAAQQDGWLAPGDQTTSTRLSGSDGLSAWHYLSAVDVAAESDVTTIVTLGDSITDGVGSSTNTNQRWPDHFARRLLEEDGNLSFAVANAGLSGNRVLHENSPRFGENLLARLERDVLALSNVSHIVLLEGINDIGMATMFPGEEVSAEEIIAGYRQVIARAHDRGIRVIGATLTPFEGAGYYHPEGERKRQAVNEWIRGGGELDGVIDFERAVMDPDNPARLRQEFTSDNLHPNDAGYEAMAGIVPLELFGNRARRPDG